MSLNLQFLIYDEIPAPTCGNASFCCITLLRPLLSKIFCTPATSAPVVRVFSRSDLIVRLRRAKISDPADNWCT